MCVEMVGIQRSGGHHWAKVSVAVTFQSEFERRKRYESRADVLLSGGRCWAKVSVVMMAQCDVEGWKRVESSLDASNVLQSVAFWRGASMAFDCDWMHPISTGL